MLRDRAVASARAFLSNSHFDVMVDVTNLKPKEGWMLWVDEEGNRLRILKNKSVQVYPAKEPIQVTTDIFKKADPALIAKHSYWVLMMRSGKSVILSFLGNDGILRSCLFESHKWVHNFSSILLGSQALKYISSGYIENKPRKLKSLSIKHPKSFNIEGAWATGYPSSNDKLQEQIECHLTNQDSKE